MAGRGKVAVLATLMFAMLLSCSLIEAARPIVSEGSNVAADGSVMVRDAHARQLRTFFGWGWGFGNWFGGCGGWFGGWFGGCNGYWWGKRLSARKLNTFGYFPGWRGWWGGWGNWWGGWGGYGWGFGRK